MDTADLADVAHNRIRDAERDRRRRQAEQAWQPDDMTQRNVIGTQQEMK